MSLAAPGHEAIDCRDCCCVQESHALAGIATQGVTWLLIVAGWYVVHRAAAGAGGGGHVERIGRDVPEPRALALQESKATNSAKVDNCGVHANIVRTKLVHVKLVVRYLYAQHGET